MAALGIAEGAYDIGCSPAVAQECVNLYPEVMEQKARSKVILRSTPGLSTWATLTQGTIRGAIVMAGVLYVVNGTSLVSVSTAGVETIIGNIDGVDRCGMAANSTDELIIVRGGNVGFVDQYFVVSGTINGGYTYSVADGLDAITDPDFPTGDLGGQFWISNLNDGSTWIGTDNAVAEGNPDDIVAMVMSHRETILLGARSIEYWRNTGNADFAFERQDGTHQDRGCAAQYSAVLLDNRVLFLGEDGIVYVINGYQPQRVSNFGVEEWLRQNESDWADATATGHTWRGHHFYALTVGARTFVYDATHSELTGKATWHERRSGTGDVRWRPDWIVRYAGRTLAMAPASGVIYEISETTYTDGGETIERIRAIAPLSADVKSISIPRLELRMESGTGALAVDPIIMLQISRDGGRTWDSGLQGNTGLQGAYSAVAVWTRLGRAEDWLFRFKSTDPYKQTWIEAHADVFIGN
jgi:hypothetical protein